MARRTSFLISIIMFTSLVLVAQRRTPVAASDKADPIRLSGTVADASGAVIAGAAVLVRSANGTVQTTQSDATGYFVVSGLSAGTYRLVVSKPGFETKETPITISNAEAPGPLHISLAVSIVSTTINVEGRQDSLRCV